MAQPNIPAIDVAGSSSSIVDFEGSVNQLINQSIKSGSMTGSQTLTLVTQDGTNNTITLAASKDGIISGCAFSWTGTLTASIGIGNYQGLGVFPSVAAPAPIAFAARDASLPRIDLVVGDALGAITVIAGIPAANPLPNTASMIIGNKSPLYAVWIDPTAAAVPNDFVVGSFEVNETFPTGSSSIFAYGVKSEQVPTAPRMNEIDPLAQRWDSDVIFVDTSAMGITLNLPDPTDPQYLNRKWTIIDMGNATINTIVLDPTAAGPYTVNGVGSFTITTAYQQVTLISFGGAYYAQ